MAEPATLKEIGEDSRQHSSNEPEQAFDDEKDTRQNDVRLHRTVSSVQPNYPSAAKLTVIMASLYVSVFLIALDRTIIGVAIPRITDEFNSLADVGM
jgi:hypothetical protein